ncbi:hypothetical protein CMI47_20860 [Candidatus Pacearchaeota archaeon]|nr:hypothetical protein [Candidatus Pacearchaeota archaeon]
MGVVLRVEESGQVSGVRCRSGIPPQVVHFFPEPLQLDGKGVMNGRVGEVRSQLSPYILANVQLGLNACQGHRDPARPGDYEHENKGRRCDKPVGDLVVDGA